jgi:hypothetical protein
MDGGLKVLTVKSGRESEFEALFTEIEQRGHVLQSNIFRLVTGLVPRLRVAFPRNE